MKGLAMNLKLGQKYSSENGHLLVIQQVNPTTIEYLDALGEMTDQRVTSRIGWEISIKSGDLVLIKQTEGRR